MRCGFVLLLTVALLGCATVHQNTEEIVDRRGIMPLVRSSGVSDVQLSPDGKVLAIASSEGENAQVVFLNTDSLSLVGAFHSKNHPSPFGLIRHVFSDLEWVTDQRIVAQIVLQAGPVGSPLAYGDIIAVNLDGSDARLIFGNAGDEAWRRTMDSTGEIGGVIPEGGGRIWVPAIRWARGLPVRSEVFDVDIFRGEKKSLAEGPGVVRRYFIDDKGAVRVAWRTGDTGVHELYVLKDEWMKLEASGDVRPIGYSGLARTVYMVDDDADGPALAALELETNRRTVVARMPGVEPGEVIFDPRTGRPIAVEFELDYPKWHFIEESHPIADVLRLVLERYPGHHASLKSLSADGTRAVVLAHSDRSPGQYVLVSAAQKSVRELFPVRKSVDPKQMSPVEAFMIKASDGLELRGYLTVPPSAKGPAPMVVIPHDGPDETRDRWAFDAESQLFASAGFVVLRVNYRGSGGYGAKFRLAGEERWGDRIQDDIIEATQWAIAEKIADPKRICTFGFGFGGYSAFQATIRKPELFQCAVGYAGVYDLAAHTRGGAPGSTEMAFEDVLRAKKPISANEEALRAHSPRHHPEDIKVPVLMIHGRGDKHAPFDDANKLCLELKKQKKTCETFFVLEQGHRFFGDRDRFEAYARALDFLEKHTRR